MLQLIEIKKDYISKNQPTVNALKGISLSFRKSEFVSILGPSGCGKTTLLNIMGGLDTATSGELIISGKSTKNYTDRDWDTYRNHSIGFVFQSYHLITHINVLANVEIALTIGGVSKSVRKKLAKDALKQVGLEGMEKKMPNQLSGGQMQRVSIARALVNNPEIVLADEPTGALDSETSVQIMDLLKEISKSRLVIMVTHNPELAEQYSTRIVRMSDGIVVDDSDSFKPSEDYYQLSSVENEKDQTKRTSMSFKTALGLSFTNLLTKKWRTFLTAFAGSIGIIGIALVLSVSFGFNQYIDNVQQDALSSYPMTISKTTVDTTQLLASLLNNVDTSKEKFPETNMVTNNDTLSKLLSQYADSSSKNDIKAFKTYLESAEVQLKYGEYMTGIQYKYYTQFNLFPTVADGKSYKRTFPYDLYSGDWEYIKTYFNSTSERAKIAACELSTTAHQLIDEISSLLTSDLMAPLCEMIPTNPAVSDGKQYNEILDRQYDVLAGEMPKSKEELVLIVDEYNNIDNFLLYALGQMSPQDMVESILKRTCPAYVGYINPTQRQPVTFNKSFNDLLGLTFKLPTSFKIYENKGDANWYLKTGDALASVLNDPSTLELKVVGIVRQKKDVTTAALTGAIGYLPSLTEYMIEETDKTPAGYDTVETNIVMARKQDKVHTIYYYDLPYYQYNRDTKECTVRTLICDKTPSIEGLGLAQLDDPYSIYIYAKDFEAKNKIKSLINDYNKKIEQEVKEAHKGDIVEPGEEEQHQAAIDKEINDKQIKVNDSVAVLMSSVQTIVNSVSYVLIAFISISLVVSSIMIGIITYVSVLERTKEIGILRSVGARKVDISSVFNAETLMIGLTAGIIGDIISLLLDIPIRYIIMSLTTISINIVVPWYGLLLLPAISILLTIVSGLIPSTIASRKDPAVALRSE